MIIKKPKKELSRKALLSPYAGIGYFTQVICTYEQGRDSRDLALDRAQMLALVSVAEREAEGC